jgi:hypothetical protein
MFRRDDFSGPKGTAITSRRRKIGHWGTRDNCHGLFEMVCGGSASTPLCETAGTGQRLRLKQHGLRSPFLSLSHAVAIRCLRVAACLVEPIQRIQSQRAIGVISFQRAYAGEEAASAFFRSGGTEGSGQSVDGSIASVAVSPAVTLAPRNVLSILSQWLPFPSGLACPKPCQAPWRGFCFSAGVVGVRNVSAPAAVMSAQRHGLVRGPTRRYRDAPRAFAVELRWMMNPGISMLPPLVNRVVADGWRTKRSI